MKVKALLASAGLTLVVLLGIACGQDVPQTPTPLSPLGVVQRSVEKASGIESLSYNMVLDMDMDLEGLGDDLSVSMTMDGKWAQPGGMQADMIMTMPGFEMDMSMVVSDSGLFIEIPEAGWVRFDPEEVEELGTSLESVTDPMAFQSSIFPEREIPWHLYQAQSLGREVLDGEEMEHLKVQLDFPGLWEQLSAEEREAFFLAQGGADLTRAEWERAMEGATIENLEMWVDDQGFQRRVLMKMVMDDVSLEENLGTMVMSLDMSMFDYNQPVTIEPPPDFVEFEDL